jgi:hypothetical protein
VGYVPVMRPALLATSVLCGTAVLGGCFTTSADYQHDAEEFILNNEDLASAAGTEGDPLTFESATCEKPESQDAGTTFACTGIDDQQRVWEFEVDIQAENTYVVNVSRDPRTDRD